MDALRPPPPGGKSQAQTKSCSTFSSMSRGKSMKAHRTKLGGGVTQLIWMQNDDQLGHSRWEDKTKHRVLSEGPPGGKT